MDNLLFKSGNNGQVNVDQAQGIVECFVAGIGNKDSVGDIVISGAFAKSLTHRKPRVVWGHSWNDPIGKVLEMYEVPIGDSRLPAKMRNAGIGGLYAKVQFNLQSEKGKEAFSTVAFFGEDQEWSIGYKTIDSVFDQNLQANILKEVELYEVSPVLHGANQLTGTISIKADEKAHMPIIPLQGEGMQMMPMMNQTPRIVVVATPNSQQNESTTDNPFAEGMSRELQQPDKMALQAELIERTGSKIEVMNATENIVVFRRTTSDGKASMYRLPYHKEGGQFMFGKPEPYEVEAPNPQPMQNIEQKPGAPVVVPNGGIAYRNDDQQEMLTMFGGSVESPFGKSEISHLIELPESYMASARDFVNPVLRHHKLVGRPSAKGIIIDGVLTANALDALQNAVKALGSTIGQMSGNIGQAIGKIRDLAQTFNPYALDGDGDGFVQDGSAFQRPYIPIKKPGFDLPDVRGRKRSGDKLLDKPRPTSALPKDRKKWTPAQRQEALLGGLIEPETREDVAFLANKRPENEGIAKYWDMSEADLTKEGNKLINARKQSAGTEKEKIDEELLKVSHEFQRRASYAETFGQEFVPPAKREIPKPDLVPVDITQNESIARMLGAPKSKIPRTDEGFASRYNKYVDKFDAVVEQMELDSSTTWSDLDEDSRIEFIKELDYDYMYDVHGNLGDDGIVEAMESGQYDDEIAEFAEDVWDTIAEEKKLATDKERRQLDQNESEDPRNIADAEEAARIEREELEEERTERFRPTMAELAMEAEAEDEIDGALERYVGELPFGNEDDEDGFASRGSRNLAPWEEPEPLVSYAGGTGETSYVDVLSGFVVDEINDDSRTFRWIREEIATEYLPKAKPGSEEFDILKGIADGEGISYEDYKKLPEELLDDIDEFAVATGEYEDFLIERERRDRDDGFASRGEPPIDPPDPELSDEFIEDYLTDNLSMGELDFETLEKYNNSDVNPLQRAVILDMYERYTSEDPAVSAEAVDEILSRFYTELVDDNYDSMVDAKNYRPDYDDDGFASRGEPFGFASRDDDGEIKQSKLDEMVEDVKTKLIAELETADPSTWKPSWRNDSLPINPTTGKPYRGFNAFWLMMRTRGENYSTGRFAGFNQLKARGAQVRKGEKGVPILRPQLMKKEDDDGNVREFVVFRGTTVFNIDQTDGGDEALRAIPADLPEEQRIKILEATIADLGVNVVTDNMRGPHYSPTGDYVSMPDFSKGTSALEWNSSLAHETIHWTGGASRLNRPSVANYSDDSKTRAYEELVAEIGSAMFLAAHGIDAPFREDHAPYIKGWISLLKDDPDALSRAFKDATAAINHVLEKSPNLRKLFGGSDSGKKAPEVDAPNLVGAAVNSSEGFASLHRVRTPRSKALGGILYDDSSRELMVGFLKGKPWDDASPRDRDIFIDRAEAILTDGNRSPSASQINDYAEELYDDARDIGWYVYSDVDMTEVEELAIARSKGKHINALKKLKKARKATDEDQFNFFGRDEKMQDVVSSKMSDGFASRGAREPQEGLRRHKLMPADIRRQMPQLDSTEEVPTDEKILAVKFFSPYSDWTWYGVEFDGEDMFFGYVEGFEKEWGYFSLDELAKTQLGGMVPAVERDTSFRPTKFGDLNKADGFASTGSKRLGIEPNYADPAWVDKTQRRILKQNTDWGSLSHDDQIDWANSFLQEFIEENEMGHDLTDLMNGRRLNTRPDIGLMNYAESAYARMSDAHMARRAQFGEEDGFASVGNRTRRLGMQPSEAVDYVAYDPDSESLFVAYKRGDGRGDMYVYEGVSMDDAVALENAPSAGRAINDIKRRKDVRKATPDEVIKLSSTEERLLQAIDETDAVEAKLKKAKLDQVVDALGDKKGIARFLDERDYQFEPGRNEPQLRIGERDDSQFRVEYDPDTREYVVTSEYWDSPALGDRETPGEWIERDEARFDNLSDAVEDVKSRLSARDADDDEEAKLDRELADVTRELDMAGDAPGVESIDVTYSSALTAVDYNPATKEMRVSYNGGGTYIYEGVDADELEAFKSAPSKGRAINDIKRAHPFRQDSEWTGGGDEDGGIEEFDVRGSAAVEQVAYDPEKEDLMVIYSGGKGYVYTGVTREEADAVRSASSKGRAINDVKRTHEVRKLTGEDVRFFGSKKMGELTPSEIQDDKELDADELRAFIDEQEGLLEVMRLNGESSAKLAQQKTIIDNAKRDLLASDPAPTAKPKMPTSKPPRGGKRVRNRNVAITMEQGTLDEIIEAEGKAITVDELRNAAGSPMGKYTKGPRKGKNRGADTITVRDSETGELLHSNEILLTSSASPGSPSAANRKRGYIRARSYAGRQGHNILSDEGPSLRGEGRGMTDYDKRVYGLGSDEKNREIGLASRGYPIIDDNDEELGDTPEVSPADRAAFDSLSPEEQARRIRETVGRDDIDARERAIDDYANEWRFMEFDGVAGDDFGLEDDDDIPDEDGFASTGGRVRERGSRVGEDINDFRRYLDSEYGEYFMEYTQMDDEELKQTLMTRYRMSRGEARDLARQIRRDEKYYYDLWEQEDLRLNDLDALGYDSDDGFASRSALIGKLKPTRDERSLEDPNTLEYAYDEVNLVNNSDRLIDYLSDLGYDFDGISGTEVFLGDDTNVPEIVFGGDPERAAAYYVIPYNFFAPSSGQRVSPEEVNGALVVRFYGEVDAGPDGEPKHYRKFEFIGEHQNIEDARREASIFADKNRNDGFASSSYKEDKDYIDLDDDDKKIADAIQEAIDSGEIKDESLWSDWVSNKLSELSLAEQYEAVYGEPATSTDIQEYASQSDEFYRGGEGRWDNDIEQGFYDGSLSDVEPKYKLRGLIDGTVPEGSTYGDDAHIAALRQSWSSDGFASGPSRIRRIPRSNTFPMSVQKERGTGYITVSAMVTGGRGASEEDRGTRRMQITFSGGSPTEAKRNFLYDMDDRGLVFAGEDGFASQGGRLGPPPDDAEYGRELAAQRARDRAAGRNATNPIGRGDDADDGFASRQLRFMELNKTEDWSDLSEAEQQEWIDELELDDAFESGATPKEKLDIAQDAWDERAARQKAFVTKEIMKELDAIRGGLEGEPDRKLGMYGLDEIAILEIEEMIDNPLEADSTDYREALKLLESMKDRIDVYFAARRRSDEDGFASRGPNDGERLMRGANRDFTSDEFSPSEYRQAMSGLDKARNGSGEITQQENAAIRKLADLYRARPSTRPTQTEAINDVINSINSYRSRQSGGFASSVSDFATDVPPERRAIEFKYRDLDKSDIDDEMRDAIDDFFGDQEKYELVYGEITDEDWAEVYREYGGDQGRDIGESYYYTEDDFLEAIIGNQTYDDSDYARMFNQLGDDNREIFYEDNLIEPKLNPNYKPDGFASRGGRMKASKEQIDKLRNAIAPLDTQERRARYLRGDYPRSENTRDLDVRYAFDLLWEAIDAGDLSYSDIENLNDAQTATALRNVVPKLVRSNADGFASRGFVDEIDVSRSTAVERVAYDPDKEELLVVYEGGNGYIYSGVTPEEVDGLKYAPSKGRAINEIKRTHDVRKTESVEDGLDFSEREYNFARLDPEEQNTYFQRALTNNADSGLSSDAILDEAKKLAMDDREMAQLERQAVGMGASSEPRKIDVSSSSALNYVAYDEKNRVLEVEYRGRNGKGTGTLYKYQDVEPDVVDRIENSDSRGATMRGVRDNYEFTTSRRLPDSAYEGLASRGGRQLVVPERYRDYGLNKNDLVDMLESDDVDPDEARLIANLWENSEEVWDVYLEEALGNVDGYMDRALPNAARNAYEDYLSASADRLEDRRLDGFASRGSRRSTREMSREFDKIEVLDSTLNQMTPGEAEEYREQLINARNQAALEMVKANGLDPKKIDSMYDVSTDEDDLTLLEKYDIAIDDADERLESLRAVRSMAEAKQSASSYAWGESEDLYTQIRNGFIPPRSYFDSDEEFIESLRDDHGSLLRDVKSFVLGDSEGQSSDGLQEYTLDHDTYLSPDNNNLLKGLQKRIDSAKTEKEFDAIRRDMEGIMGDLVESHEQRYRQDEANYDYDVPGVTDDDELKPSRLATFLKEQDAESYFVGFSSRGDGFASRESLPKPERLRSRPSRFYPNEDERDTRRGGAGAPGGPPPPPDGDDDDFSDEGGFASMYPKDELGLEQFINQQELELEDYIAASKTDPIKYPPSGIESTKKRIATAKRDLARIQKNKPEPVDEEEEFLESIDGFASRGRRRQGRRGQRMAPVSRYSAEDRQALADGNILRSRKRPGKRRQGPSADEFDGFASRTIDELPDADTPLSSVPFEGGEHGPGKDISLKKMWENYEKLIEEKGRTKDNDRWLSPDVSIEEAAKFFGVDKNVAAKLLQARNEGSPELFIDDAYLASRINDKFGMERERLFGFDPLSYYDDEGNPLSDIGWSDQDFENAVEMERARRAARIAAREGRKVGKSNLIKGGATIKDLEDALKQINPDIKLTDDDGGPLTPGAMKKAIDALGIEIPWSAETYRKIQRQGGALSPEMIKYLVKRDILDPSFAKTQDLTIGQALQWPGFARFSTPKIIDALSQTLGLSREEIAKNNRTVEQALANARANRVRVISQANIRAASLKLTKEKIAKMVESLGLSAEDFEKWASATELAK